MRKWKNVLPRPVLMTLYKAFVRPHLDYDDVIYDGAYNETIHQKLEPIQYNARLTYRELLEDRQEKTLQELDLESLKRRRWYRKLCLFYEIFKEDKSFYLFNLIPTKNLYYNSRNTNKITLWHTKHNLFKTSFLPPALLLNEKRQTLPNLKNPASLSVFKSN